MQSRWISDQFLYDGSQLKSLFAYLRWGILGDSIVAWAGPCDVRPDHMVDGEDQRLGAEIRGSSMLHFIVEKFNCDMLGAVALQRLLAALALEALREQSPDSDMILKLRREGDDLFLEGKKLSISIATVSPTSALIHFAVNLSNQGTPVPTLCLADLGVESEAFAQQLMNKFTMEVVSIVAATQKVHWVR